MPNPHYSPEVQVKISLVNFTVTQSGLEEQLLGATVGTRVILSFDAVDAILAGSAQTRPRPPRDTPS